MPELWQRVVPATNSGPQASPLPRLRLTSWDSGGPRAEQSGLLAR